MATLNLGRLKPVFRSSWNSATAYNVDDIVVRNNQSYISIQAGTNQDPATATAYWTLMAAAGTDVGAALQNKEIAFKTNAGAVDGIPIGNAGEFLKVNSGATGYEFSPLSSDFVKVASGNTTATGVIDIQGCFSTDYKIYKLFCHHNFVSGSYLEVGFLNASDNSFNDSSYYAMADGMYSQNGTGNSRWTGNSHNYNKYEQNDTDGFRVINTWQSHKTDEHSMLDMTFDNPIASRKTMVQGLVNFSSTGYVGTLNFTGMHDSTNSISGLRLSSSDNSINFTTTGYYAVYGLKH